MAVDGFEVGAGCVFGVALATVDVGAFVVVGDVFDPPTKPEASTQNDIKRSTSLA